MTDSATPRIMLDLETLGTGLRAAIVQIGAVAFDETGPIGSSFFRRITLRSALEHGEMDAETLKWWLLQSDEARSGLVGEQYPRTKLELAILDFWAWKFAAAGRGRVQVWGNGSSFDLKILAEAYRTLGRRVPWAYRDERDLRTLLDFFPVPEPEREGVHHNALDDAMHQARWAALALKAHAAATGGGS